MKLNDMGCQGINRIIERSITNMKIRGPYLKGNSFVISIGVQFPNKSKGSKLKDFKKDPRAQDISLEYKGWMIH